MKKCLSRISVLCMLLFVSLYMTAQQRRPIDSQHPLWLVHVDVWNNADPQKIIDLIPDDIKPYVCMNLSLSCQYDKEKKVYKMPRCAVRTYKSWASVCQLNNMWFTCQPASGGHTHIQDNDLETFEYFFKAYPNFLGWNYAEQFWGFDEPGDESSSTQASRIELFSKLVPMHHKYGGFLTISFCGNIWSHALNPMGMMKRNSKLLQACKDYPEACLWLYKYTTSSCWYVNESVTFGPFVSGLAKNYGVRYDNCGYNGALEAIFGKDNGKKYPGSAGIGTVMEQTCVNGGAVWDGPELIWTEDFQGSYDTTVDNGYTRRNWGTFPNFRGVWIDMFRKVIDGTLYIPTREEVVGNIKVAVKNDVTSGNDENKYAAWGDLYDGLYKQDDPFNRGNGQWMDNFLYLKKTGRYGTIPLVIDFYDDAAKAIPVKVNKSSKWSSQSSKVSAFNSQYPEVSSGDLYVNRYRNRLVTYTPYSYLNSKTTATATIPLQYNTCSQLTLTLGKLSSGYVREYADHIDFYLNNYRSDSTAILVDRIVVSGCSAKPSFTVTRHTEATTGSHSESWDASSGTYTLNVSHLGPVDVCLNCSGSNSGRHTDVLPLLSLPTPQQPSAFTGPVVIEAENMDRKNVSPLVLTNSGYYAPEMKDFAGMGYVETGTNTAGSLRHQLKLQQGGDYIIYVRYCESSKSGNMTLTVNSTAKTLNIAQTGRNDWRKASVTATLQAGTNTLVLTNSSGISMKIDQIVYMPADTPAEQFQLTVRGASHGSITANKSTATEGETVTLTVNPDNGYSLQEVRVVNSVYYTQGTTLPLSVSGNQASFVMPDDNLTLLPVFAVASTESYELQFDAYGKATGDVAFLQATGGLAFDAATGKLATNGSEGALTLTFATPVDLQYLNKLEIAHSGDGDIIDRLYFYEDEAGTVENQSWSYSKWGGTTDANATSKFTGKTIKKMVWKSAAGKSTSLTATITGIAWRLKTISAQCGQNITTLPFKTWSADGDNDATVTGEVASWECQQNFNTLTSDVIYGGDGIGGSKRYADLTGFKKLVIRGYGTIRLFYNWVQSPESKPMEYITINGTEVQPYVFDIESFMAEKGLSHFHLVGVKGSGACFVESISVLTGQERADYYLSGVGHRLPSVVAALADASATSYDVTGLTVSSPVSLTPANPNALLVAQADQLTNPSNVIVNGACDHLVLTDDHPFAAPVDFTATAATYTTTLNPSAQAGTLCLPFAATIPTGVEAFTLTYTGGSSATAAALPTVVPARTPVMLRGSGSQVFQGSGAVTLSAVPVSGALTGVFAATTVPLGSYVLQNGSQGLGFYPVQSAITASPFRAYLSAEGGHARLSVTYVDATGVGTVRSDDEQRCADEYFDLQGRRVLKPSKGLYIQKGQKRTVRSF